MTTVLVLPGVAKDLNSMLPLGAAISRTPESQATFVVVNPNLFSSRASAEAVGCRFIIYSPGRRAGNGLRALADTFLIRLSGLLVGDRRTSDVGYLRARLKRISTRILMKRFLNSAQRLIDEIAPSVVLVSSDRLVNFELAVLKTCMERNIPTVIPPIANPDAEGMVLSRKERAIYRLDHSDPSGWKKWIHENLPLQIYPSSYGELLFLDAPTSLGLHDLGVLPPRPWGLGGSFCSKVCVDGESTRVRLIRDGTPKEKIVVTGHPVHDHLFAQFTGAAALRKYWETKYGFDSRKKVYILAVPQLAEHDICTWDRHWKEIDYLVETMAATGQNLLLSLHPRMDREKYLYLEKKAPCRIADEPTQTVVTAAELFVAAYSSTIEWAILCGIPSITVDFYGIDATTFDEFHGVLKVTDKTQFAEALARLTEDHSYYEKIASAQVEGRRHLAPFDGRSTERILEVVFSSIRK